LADVTVLLDSTVNGKDVTSVKSMPADNMLLDWTVNLEHTSCTCMFTDFTVDKATSASLAN
jgi:hypothetical protein